MIMTRKFEQIVGYTTNFAFYTTCFPIKWNLHRHRLEPGPILLEYWWTFLCFINATWRLIVSIIFIVNVISFNITGARIILCFTMWCCLLLSIFMHYALCFKIVDWRDVINHINDLIKMDKKFELLRKKLENSGTSESTSKHGESECSFPAKKPKVGGVKGKRNVGQITLKKSVHQIRMDEAAFKHISNVAQVTCKISPNSDKLSKKNKIKVPINSANESCKEAFELAKFARVTIVAAIWALLLSFPLVLFMMIFEYDIFRGIASQTSFEFNFFMAGACSASLYCDAFLAVVSGNLTMYHCKFFSHAVKLIGWKPGYSSIWKNTTKLQYRQLQALHSQGMALFGPMLPSLASIAVLFIISLILSTIKFGTTSLNIFMSIATTMIGILLIDFAEHFHRTIWCITNQSYNYIISYNQNLIIRKNSIEFKFLKSCKPIDVRIGSLFYIQRLTFLNLIGVVIFPTVINLLITFR